MSEFLEQQRQRRDENRNPLTDPELMLSPGQSSVRSLPVDKEAVQVYVRVRPPFNHEVEDDYYPGEGD